MVAHEAGAANFRWHILGSALLVQVTISVVTQAFPALVPFAKGDLGLSTAEVGLFATILSFGTMLALLPAGWAVDVLGERRVLVVGGICTGLVAIAASMAPSFIILIPLLILVGVAAATPTPAGSTAIIGAFALRDRGFVMSIRQTGIPIGGALAALVLPPIALASSWRIALVAAAVVAVIGALIARVIVRGAPLTTNVRAREEGTSFWAVASREATYVGLAGMVLAAGQFVLVSYIALYLFEANAIPVGIGSLFLVAANLGGAGGRMAWGTISDRVFGGRRATPLIVASVCSAVCFAVLAGLPTTTPPALILVLVALLGATVIGWNGVYITLLSEIAMPHRRARTVAYGMTITQVGIFAGPFGFGLLVEATHSYRLAWAAVAASMMLAAALLYRVHEPRQGGSDGFGISIGIPSPGGLPPANRSTASALWRHASSGSDRSSE
jgi:sugar phosphate permease